MAGVTRFGVSLDSGLLARFDALLDRRGYTNRSEAIRDLIREALIEEEWKKGAGEVAGTVTLVYDHHTLELPRRLTDLQHEHHGVVVSTLHVHLDAHNCLEVLVLRGRAKDVRSLGERLVSTNGVKHGKLVLTTTGRDLA